MNIIFSYFLLFILFLISKHIFTNLKSKFYSSHQKLAGKESIPLIGGIIFFFYYSLSFSLLNDFGLFLSSFLILFIGILSDTNYLKSPRLRLVFQTFILLVYIYSSNLVILDLRNDLLNFFLSNYYFGIIFTTFCFLVLINGSNFIDGLDGLNLGYFLTVIVIVLSFEDHSLIDINYEKILIIIYPIIFLFILNFFKILYLGDSGSYFVGFLIGVVLIELSRQNEIVSPFFIANLLWYPAFENLFSIIRKNFLDQDPLKPDNLHLHQLIFAFFKRRKNPFLKKISNIFSSLIIIFYNLILLLICRIYFDQTKKLIFILIINIIIYLILYFYLINRGKTARIS